MDGCYLGVDTGGTKSEALLADSAGNVLGFARGGPGNWEMIGWQGARAVLQEIIGRAAADAGVDLQEITASGLGLAGCDWPEDLAPHLALLRAIGLRDPIILVNDSALGLPAGAAAGWGVVISAGTSCNCYGRDAAGRVGRMSGASVFGEYAGGGELVQAALQAVGRAWSLRGPSTLLSAAFVEAAGAVDVDDLLAGLVRGRYMLNASYAPLVFAAAAAGDPVAGDAVTWAGRQLADLGLGVIRQLKLQEHAFEVVLSGSFYKGSPRLQTEIEAVITAAAPGARISRLAAPPVIGGALLAMETQIAITPQIRRTLRRSAEAARPV